MKRYVVFSSFLFLFFSISLLHGWTWFFQKKFNNAQLRRCANKECVVTKNNLPAFNQLIFSWNARRPKKGYFSFYAQIRDSVTKKWHDWHHLVDWGAGVQRSYFNKASSGSVNHFVRLETPQKSYADAVKIKITSNKGADIKLLKSVATSVANLDKCMPEKIDKSINALPSVHIKGVPCISQMALNHPKKRDICSPTSSAMLVGFIRQQSVDPILFAENSFDNGLKVYGSWPFNLAHAYEHCNGKALFHVMRLSSFKKLHDLLIKNIPVVVSVRGTIKGAPKPYSKGHLLVVVGWDKKTKKILCHDPAIYGHDNIHVAYDVVSFLRAWERSKRLAYVADPISV